MGKNLTCPKCTAKLRITEKHLGKTIRCPQCEAKLKVPGGPPASPPTPDTTSDTTSDTAQPSTRSAAAATPLGERLWEEDFGSAAAADEAASDWDADAWDNEETDWNSLPQDLERYGQELSDGPPDVTESTADPSSLVMGTPIRTSVMDHPSYQQPNGAGRVPGAGVLNSVTEFFTTAKGILLGVMLLVIIGVGWPLVNLYNQWNKDSGAADGDELQMTRTGTNLLRLAQAGKQIAESERPGKGSEIVSEALADVRQNNADFNQAAANRDQQGRQAAAQLPAPPPAGEKPRPFVVEKPKARHRDRPAEEILKRAPSITAVTGTEYVISFDTRLSDVEFAWGAGEESDTSDPDELTWQTPLTSLKTPDDATVLNLQAAVTEWQNLIYLSEGSHDRLRSGQLPIAVRLGREKMRVTALDEFTSAAALSRPEGNRSWHSVSESLVIVNEPGNDNPAYFELGKPLFQDEVEFCWIPTVNDVGQRTLHVRWKEKLAPYQGSLDVTITVLSESQAAELREQQIAERLSTIPKPWHAITHADAAAAVATDDRLTASRELKPLLRLPHNRRYADTVPVVAVTVGSTAGTLTTNVMEDNKTVEIPLARGTGIPLMSVQPSLAMDQNATESDDDQAPSTNLETHLVRLTGLTKWVSSETSDPNEPERLNPSPATAPKAVPLGDHRLLFLADEHHLLLVNTSDWRVEAQYSTQSQITDVAVCSKGPVLLVRDSGMSSYPGGLSRDLWLPVAASDGAEDAVSTSQLLLLNTDTLRPEKAWALHAQAVAADLTSPHVYIATSAMVGALDLDDEMLIDLKTISEPDPGDRNGTAGGVQLKLLPEAAQLFVWRSGNSGSILQYDLATEILTEQNRTQFASAQVHLHDAAELPGLLMSVPGAITQFDASDLTAYSPSIRLGLSQPVPSLAVDAETRSMMCVGESRNGPFQSHRVILLIGPHQEDLSEEIPDALSVCSVAPRTFLVTTMTGQCLVEVQKACDHWPFAYAEQQEWSSVSVPVQSVEPESPESMEIHKGDQYPGLSASHRFVGWTYDGAAWLTAVVKGRGLLTLHRFDAATGTESHQIRLPANDPTFNLQSCPAGALLFLRGRHGIELYSADDLQPLWRYTDDSITEVRCSAFHNNIAVSTSTDLVILNAATGQITQRFSRTKLLIEPRTAAFQNGFLIPTTVPELFYLSKSRVTQKSEDLIGPFRFDRTGLTPVEVTDDVHIDSTLKPSGTEYNVSNQSRLTIRSTETERTYHEEFLHRITAVHPHPTKSGTVMIACGSSLLLIQKDMSSKE